MSVNKRLLFAGLGTLFLLVVWQGPIERAVPLIAAPVPVLVLFVLYTIAVLLPWLLLRRGKGKKTPPV
jgi:hypothetical protein